MCELLKFEIITFCPRSERAKEKAHFVDQTYRQLIYFLFQSCAHQCVCVFFFFVLCVCVFLSVWRVCLFGVSVCFVCVCLFLCVCMSVVCVCLSVVCVCVQCNICHICLFSFGLCIFCVCAYLCIDMCVCLFARVCIERSYIKK